MAVFFFFRIMGVKGPSIFATQPGFDVVKGFVIDPLHCVFQGVTLDLLKRWMDDKYKQDDYSLQHLVSMTM